MSFARPSHFFSGILAVTALASACVEGAPPVAPTKPTPSSSSGFDPCLNDKPVWRTYDGPLKAARCEQEMFLTMGGIADQLGVDCNHCHEPKSAGQKGYNYDVMTPKKETALWMSRTFMSNLKRADGQPMTCGSCHVDKKGKPSAKFLGTPRDSAWAVEWMTTVMTNRFVALDGSKLKCKSCHVGTWGAADFQPKVIGRTEQVPHSPPPPEASAPDAVPPEAVPPDASAPAPSASAPPASSSALRPVTPKPSAAPASSSR